MVTRLRGRSGIRWQATAAAAAVVAVGLVAASVALLVVLQSSLTSTLQDTLTALVAEDVQTLAAGGLSALEASETDRGHTSLLVQVIGPDGTVAYTSQPAVSQPVSPLRPRPGQTETAGRSFLPRLDSDARPLVVASGASTSEGDYVVLASSPLTSQGEAVATTAGLLAVLVPLTTLLVAAVTWWRVGRALGSVEAIRGQVEGIGAANLSDRVPVPDSRDEIARLAQTMNDMLDRLESADRAQRQFVADASHELRSPLATVAASVEVGAGDPTGRTWSSISPLLHAEVQRMARLVNDLLLLSRLDDAKSTAATEDVDLDDLAEREMLRLRQVSTLSVRCHAVPVRVEGERHQLTQVLRNLMDNAAAVAATTVSVRVFSQGGLAVLVVEDDGPGVPVAERNRIFDRFVRLDESRARSSGGSGLGLPIAKRITAAHGGTLAVDESSLGGARFTVTLPLQRAPAEDRVLSG